MLIKPTCAARQLIVRWHRKKPSTSADFDRLHGQGRKLVAWGPNVGIAIPENHPSCDPRPAVSFESRFEQWKKVHRSRQRQEYLFWKDLRPQKRFVKQESKRARQENKRVKRENKRVLREWAYDPFAFSLSDIEDNERTTFV